MKNTFLLAPALFVILAAGTQATGDSSQRFRQIVVAAAADHSDYFVCITGPEALENMTSEMLRPEPAFAVSGIHNATILSADYVMIALDSFDKDIVQKGGTGASSKT